MLGIVAGTAFCSSFNCSAFHHGTCLPSQGGGVNGVISALKCGKSASAGVWAVLPFKRILRHLSCGSLVLPLCGN